MRESKKEERPINAISKFVEFGKVAIDTAPLTNVIFFINVFENSCMESLSFKPSNSKRRRKERRISEIFPFFCMAIIIFLEISFEIL